MMHFGIDFWKDFGGFLKEKSRHVGIKIESGGGPEGVRGGSGGLLAAKPENERCRTCFLGPSWGRLGALLGAVLALESPSWGDFGRLGPSKNRCKNRSIFECLLGSDFWRILVDFGKKNGAKLGPKNDQKSKPPL